MASAHSAAEHGTYETLPATANDEAAMRHLHRHAAPGRFATGDGVLDDR